MGNEESDLDFGTYVHRTGMDVESGLQTVDGPCDQKEKKNGPLFVPMGYSTHVSPPVFQSTIGDLVIRA